MNETRKTEENTEDEVKIRHENGRKNRYKFWKETEKKTKDKGNEKKNGKPMRIPHN